MYYDHLVKASYITVRGYRLSAKACTATSATCLNSNLNHETGSNNIYEYLEMDHSGRNAIAIKAGPHGVYNGTPSVNNTIRYNYIHRTGLRQPGNGEGIYIGDGSCGCQIVVGTIIDHNTIDSTGAEGIELKQKTRKAVVTFNTLSMNGLSRTVGSWGPTVIRADSNVANDNVMTQTAGVSKAISVGTGGTTGTANGNTFHRNKASSFQKLFEFSSGTTGNKAYCDNIPVAPTVMGVTCPP
jgi:hypothetical protein